MLKYALNHCTRSLQLNILWTIVHLSWQCYCLANPKIQPGIALAVHLSKVIDLCILNYCMFNTCSNLNFNLAVQAWTFRQW